MDSRLTVALLVVGAVAIAVWQEWGPSNLEECLDDASTRPSNLGVQTARYRCTQKFQQPLQERPESVRATAERDTPKEREIARAHRLADDWRQKVFRQGVTLTEVIGVMGAPATKRPERCADLQNGAASPDACTTYLWRDARPLKFCPRSPTDYECYFKIQTHSSNGMEIVWAQWEDSN